MEEIKVFRQKMKEVADDARSKEEMLKHLVSALLYYTYMFIQG